MNKRRQRDAGHAPVHVHDQADGDEPEEPFADDHVDAADDEPLEFVHIIHRPAHEVAGALPLQVAQALRLKLAVDAVAEDQHEFLRHPAQDPGVQRAQHFAEQIDDEEPGDRRCQAG